MKDCMEWLTVGVCGRERSAEGLMGCGCVKGEEGRVLNEKLPIGTSRFFYLIAKTARFAERLRGAVETREKNK